MYLSGLKINSFFSLKKKKRKYCYLWFFTGNVYISHNKTLIQKAALSSYSKNFLLQWLSMKWAFIIFNAVLCYCFSLMFFSSPPFQISLIETYFNLVEICRSKRGKEMKTVNTVYYSITQDYNFTDYNCLHQLQHSDWKSWAEKVLLIGSVFLY